ncbi:hypothetical protein M405DRAFT_870049 [Rhizopogon salebrosus TDB-379]|nr:hypothetical protein M405DRAFT_870049 [Rhizopogon salebrosus TDB-379]
MLIQHPPIIDTAVVATCPSLFSSSSCYSVSSSLLQVDSSLDTPLCVVFYTVISVDDGDVLGDMNSAIFATFPSPLPP